VKKTTFYYRCMFCDFVIQSNPNNNLTYDSWVKVGARTIMGEHLLRMHSDPSP
jgi:hypothetical protein